METRLAIDRSFPKDIGGVYSRLDCANMLRPALELDEDKLDAHQSKFR